MNIITQIEKNKLVPVVIFNTLTEVEPTLKKLQAGKVYIAEICYRTDCAEEALIHAVKSFPDMLIGAGTIINKTQASSAVKAGAKFIVSPGLSEDVAQVCKESGIPYIPGVITPTEIMKALDLGLTYLKFFPAGVFGGIKALKALSSAFPQVHFLPTGGVDNSNLAQFIREKYIFAVGGSWLLKGDIVANCLEANAIIKGD